MFFRSRLTILRQAPRLLLPILLANISACQSSEREAAVLVSQDSKAQDILLLQTAISSLVNNPKVLISDAAFSRSSELIVERARNSNPDLSIGRELTRPIHFQLWIQDKNCVLEYVETGDVKIISELNCKAIKSQQ